MAQAGPVEAEPAHVVLDGELRDVLGVFLGRVGVVEAQVAAAAELLAAMPKFRQIALAWPMCR
jgi:hypothetical protein